MPHRTYRGTHTHHALEFHSNKTLKSFMFKDFLPQKLNAKYQNENVFQSKNQKIKCKSKMTIILTEDGTKKSVYVERLRTKSLIKEDKYSLYEDVFLVEYHRVSINFGYFRFRTVIYSNIISNWCGKMCEHPQHCLYKIVVSSNYPLIKFKFVLYSIPFFPQFIL